MADDNTIQEIKESLVYIKTTLENMVKNNEYRFMTLEQKFEEKIKVANNRIKDLEDNNRWMWRSIAGCIIGAVMALIIKFN